ncbi:unnamed protein product [Calypogeia fissa]
MAPPILAVIGASGKQGSSILTHLSQHPHHSTKYTLRAMVRNPSKYTAPSPSIEVVQGDYSSVETLLPALEGASFVFGMTNPDMTFHGLEAQWGKNIGDAVLATKSVQLLIYSARAGDALKMSEGTLKCYNFTGKSAAHEYISSLAIPGVVFVWPGIFMENFVTNHQKPLVEEAVTVFEACMRDDVLMPFIDIGKDLGRVVTAILDRPERYVGLTLRLVGEWMTYPSLVKRWSNATGRKSQLRKLSYEEAGTKFGGPSAPVREMIMDMYKFVNRYGYFGSEVGDPENDLSVEFTSWEDFVGRHWGAKHPSSESIPKVSESPATRALAAYYNHFSPTNNAPIEELWAMFDETAVVEFPYAPPDRPSVLRGLNAIQAYFKDWASVFEFHRWFGESVHPVVISDNGEHGDGGKVRFKAYGEVECEGLIKPTGMSYHQKYVGACEVGEDGKILRYREYWNPMAL